jgi:GT2 family glycosyltransferase
MTGAPRIAVVVVHWGDVADTLACLRSVAASAVPARPLVVVDNGTNALTPAAVAQAAPGADVVRLDANRGFAGGSNAGIDRALAAGAELVLLLNNDATVDRDCLGALVRATGAGPRVGAVGAKVLDAADPTRLWATWGRVTWRAALVELVGRDEPDDTRFNSVRDVEWVPGTAMLLTRAALAEVGLLDERFFAYHEDVDWCTRARAAGWQILFAPDARVIHRGEGSLASRGKANPARYLSARNTILYARKHASAGNWLRLAVTIAGSMPLEAVRTHRRGQRGVVSLLLRGYRDGLFDRAIPLQDLGLR